ncbi:DUF1206 domain-containing protein [Sediminibacillus halophilus]|uniref:Ribosome associated membrane protein RAMP4 n=1 Tax=Sediminibacillus halophilus TaxID=482461 RepID=A0A1G9RV66_9BACI|nr:DUF1206 domain-containing protein [Sediminibacillus halophilus]SDM27149.1 Ribosome associated membrane protein RAMP4 [Sediminibacillus halophilus]
MDIPSTKAEIQRQQTHAKLWIRRFGRIGYMAQGIVFALIGFLALLAAAGFGGKTAGTSGMFQSLAALPLGEILIWIIGFGLFGYIVWQLIRAFKDPDGYGKGIRGLTIRTGFFISALIYGGISVKALKIAVHAGRSGGNSEQTMSAKLLSQPFGPWLLGLFGFVVFCFAVYEAGIGIKGSYMKKFKQGEMEEKEEKVARITGKIGMISRGIVFGLVGYFFVQTAVTTDPDKAKGLDESLSELAQQPYGRWLLGIVSLGFILFGLYQVFRGRYQRMDFGS